MIAGRRNVRQILAISWATMALTLSAHSVAQETAPDADENSEPAETRVNTARHKDYFHGGQLAFEAQLAPLGGPLGIFGGAVDYAPHANLAISAGAGAGGFGPQLGVALRPRIISDDSAFNLSLGYSYGDYKVFRIDVEGQDGEYLYRNGFWINGDIGLEVRFDSHVLLRLFGGISQLASSSPPVWHEAGQIMIPEPGYAQSYRGPRYPVLGYVGLALGYYVSNRDDRQ